MITRYQVPTITRLWSRINQLEQWWMLEKTVCDGWHQLGVINDQEWILINHAQVLIREVDFHYWEKITHHEVSSLVRVVSEQIPQPARRWIHFGLTASDVVDTVQNLLIHESCDFFLKKLKKLESILLNKAQKYQQQLIMGRTHGMFAEPTSLGLKFLQWYAEVIRWHKKIQRASKNISVINLSGSVGTYIHVPRQLNQYVAQTLGLGLDWTSSQITQRDRYSGLFLLFSGLASTYTKIALEFRLWQKSEIQEISEQFMHQQHGSSSMPHKKNPISAENITGLARILMSNAQVFLQNNILWNERDISHSSAERVLIPQMFHLMIYTTQRLTTLVEHMVVHRDNIMRNISRTYYCFYSQLAMNYLIKKHQWLRHKAYRLVQEVAQKAIYERKNFVDLLQQKTPNIFPDNFFCLSIYLKNIDWLFTQILNNKKINKAKDNLTVTNMDTSFVRKRKMLLQEMNRFIREHYHSIYQFNTSKQVTEFLRKYPEYLNIYSHDTIRMYIYQIREGIFRAKNLAPEKEKIINQLKLLVTKTPHYDRMLVDKQFQVWCRDYDYSRTTIAMLFRDVKKRYLAQNKK